MAHSDATREAARYDADGRHTDAINTLARAARFGDLEAMTWLGRRLIAGDGTAPVPRHGAGLLIDATNRGAVAAPATLAVLAATGIACEQSWPQAMELLVLAAERGSALARGQLSVLVGDERGRNDQDWRSLGGQVDLQAWMRAPSETVLNEDPAVRSFADFVPPAVCDWLIERAADRLGPALVYDPVAEANVADAHRSNTAASFSLIETDLVMLLIQHRMWACCGVPLSNMETMTVLHYAPGEQITNHFDFVDPNSANYDKVIEEQGQRIVTFLVYLNDDYEGGETAFPRLDVSHKGRKGEGLYFVNALRSREPDRRMLHAGRPPSVGEKWVVSQFIRDRTVLRIGDAGRAGQG